MDHEALSSVVPDVSVASSIEGNLLIALVSVESSNSVLTVSEAIASSS